MDGETLRVEIDIQGISAAAAERTEELIGALREGGSATRYAALFTKLEVERVERTVRLRWALPPEVLRALASAPDGESAVQAPP